MRKHWGTGPVFAYESMLNARRWQVYAGRSVFVLLVLCGLVIVWVARIRLGFGTEPDVGGLRADGKARRVVLLCHGGHSGLAGHLGGAGIHGRVDLHRPRRGTLAHMMVTDLSDAEIVLGKLGARLAPISGLIACGVPVAALVTLLGGVDFGAIVGLFVVSVSVAVIGCVFVSHDLGLGGEDARRLDGRVHDRGIVALGAANLGWTFCEREAPSPAGVV